MITNEVPRLDTVEDISGDILSGNSYFRAWCAVVDALNAADPTWTADGSKSPQENAVLWIKTKGILS